MSQSIRKRNNVQVLGEEGRDTLIFAHGFGSEQSVWRHQVAAFKDRYRIILFDHVGCGGSDLDAYDPYRYSGVQAYAEDLLELFAEMKLSDVIFVGHSFSGMVGTLAAMVEPRRFRQLVFVKSTPRLLDDPESGYVGGFTRAELDAFFSAMSSSYHAWASDFALLAMGNPERPELGQELTRTLSSMRPDIARALARMVFQYDHRLDLPRLKVPTLILHSGEDLTVPNQVGEYMARRIPLARMTTITARGHLPHLSAPEAVNRAIDKYLSAAA